MNATGSLVGSYIDLDGIHHGYIRHADGSFTSFEYPGTPSNLEFLFVNAINDAGLIVFRAKEFDDLERTYIRHPNGELRELRVPGSVTTVARDIDIQGRMAGYRADTDMDLLLALLPGRVRKILVTFTQFSFPKV